MTQPKQDKPYITKPTTQLDLEARLKRDNLPVKEDVDPNAVNAPYKVEGNDTSAYVGVDPDKMNYASDTEKPLSGGGVEAKVAKEQLSGYAYGKDAEKEGEQTVGSGSSVPVVGVTTSGEKVSHKLVDRKGLQAQIEKNDAAVAKGESPKPIKSTAKFVSEQAQSSDEEADEDENETPSPTPQKAVAPKPS